MTVHTHDPNLTPSAHFYNKGCRHPDCTKANTTRCRSYQRTYAGREYKRQYKFNHEPSTTA